MNADMANKTIRQIREEERFNRAVGKRIAEAQSRHVEFVDNDRLLAAFAGFDDRQLRAYKEGRRSLKPYRLKQLASVLEVSADFLLGLEPQDPVKV